MADTVAHWVYETLKADGAHMSLLPGGIYLIDGVYVGMDRSPIHPDTTPEAYEDKAGTKWLLPCATISTSQEVTPGRNQMTHFVHVTYLQRGGYEAIVTARNRGVFLLDGKSGLADSKGFQLQHLNSMRNGVDGLVITGGGRKGASKEAAFFRAAGARSHT